MNGDLGLKYRKIVLAPGGSKDSSDVIKEFLGREPNEEAFMRMKGFI